MGHEIVFVAQFDQPPVYATLATSGESLATKSALSGRRRGHRWHVQVEGKVCQRADGGRLGKSFDSKVNAECAVENVRQNAGGAVGP